MTAEAQELVEQLRESARWPSMEDTSSLCLAAADLIERLSAIAATPPEWRPIETAPKDGTKFDAWVPSRFGGYRMADLSFNARGQLRQYGLLTEADLPRWPTHWRPTPASPIASIQERP